MDKISYGFDSIKDRVEVDQFGFLNLRDAFEHGSVDGAVAFDAEKYNGISDASVLMNRPRDVFEATRQSEYVKNTLKSLAAADAKAKAAASETAE